MAELTANSAISLLWQAARPSPHLREAVELVEVEINRLRAEINRHGWTADCTRCAALIDGLALPRLPGGLMPDSTVEFPPSAANCLECGHWADWHHRQPDDTFPCIGGCGCLDYRDAWGHAAACGPGCRSQHTDDHSLCARIDGSADA